LVEKLSKFSCPVIAVSLKSPYELQKLPENVASLAAWEYSEPCFEILGDVLSGKRKATGRLSI